MKDETTIKELIEPYNLRGESMSIDSSYYNNISKRQIYKNKFHLKNVVGLFAL